MKEKAGMYIRTNLARKTTCMAMGTIMTHLAYGGCAEESLTAVCSEIARIEKLISRFIPGSEISRINQSAGVNPEKVSLETFQVLSKAIDFSRCCPGCFDVTIEPLVHLWNQGKASLSEPDENRIHQVLSLVNDRDLILDPWDMTAGLRSIGQAIDPGGIGKGFAGDKILEIFKEFGVTSAYSNLGGNVVTLGSKPDGSPWRIGIQHPRQENRIIASVAVENQSVVTSGDYQRYFIDSRGRRHHHILNPATGYPAESGLISVSIVSDKSLTADALSTIMFVAGMKKGYEFLNRYPDTEAVLIDSDVKVYITPGLQCRFQADHGIKVSVLD